MKFFKSVLTVPLFMICIALISLLYSCSDSIVNSSSNAGFDSARFYWSYDTIWTGSAYSGEMYTPDTNNIFIVSSDAKSIVRVVNGAKQYYYFSSGEYARSMIGSDINNSYLFGAYSVGNVYKPLAWKWNGNGFDQITTSYLHSVDFRVYNGLYVNSNEMWIGCSKGLVLKFDGNDFQKTTYLDSLIVKNIFIDSENKLKMLAYNVLLDNDPVVVIYYIFEYQNNNWNQIYSDSTSDKAYYLLNREIVGFNEFGILSFDGHSLHKVIDFYNMTYINRVAGSSINDFVGYGRSNDSPNFGFLFHWNGKKWSKEIRGFDAFGSRLNRVNDNFYVVYNWNGSTDLYIGRRK
jgi:hypothetical protein